MPDNEPSGEEQALARMTPIISHELRNPLAVIGNSAYFIKAKLGAGGAVDPKVEKHLGIIESEIRRANETIGEILAFARMPQPALTPQRLNVLVQEALKGLPAPPPIRVQQNLSKDDPRASADPELLRQALRHLARNAIEALSGAAKPVLTVITGSADGYVFVEFADNGPGLPAEILDRLFTPFTTTKPRGIGLGLAFARKVALRHGGTLEAQSSPGKGARFRLALKPGPAS